VVPWHSAEYRFNHILNVVELSAEIAHEEGANADVTRVAALFHDVAKLEVDQDVHADAGADIAREYLTAHGDYPDSFVDQVCTAVRDHSFQGDVTDLPMETQCLIEADILDKVGASGTALMLLRMGYEARSYAWTPPRWSGASSSEAVTRATGSRARPPRPCSSADSSAPAGSRSG